MIFNKKLNTLFVKKYSLFATHYSVALPLSAIAEVYGAHRGVMGGHDDMSYYALIVKTKKDQELKILQTSKKRKVLKEVSAHSSNGCSGSWF